MAIPLAYNLRNLAVRKTTTLMTALGIALTVSVLVAVLALVNGLQHCVSHDRESAERSGDAKGRERGIDRRHGATVFEDLKSKPGIARGGRRASAGIARTGDRDQSAERSEHPDGMNVTLRGLTPVGLEMREQVKIAEGRWFRPGMREVVVGKSVAKRYPDAQLGKKLHFGRGEWEVVGVMDAGQTANNSEIFCDLNQMSGDFNRYDGLSSALVRATDAVSVEALINSINDDRRLHASRADRAGVIWTRKPARPRPIQYLGVFVSIIMAVGSSFAAMNTMYAAVARRAKEVGTLRVLGIFARQHFDQFLLRIAAVVADRRCAGVPAGAAAE